MKKNMQSFYPFLALAEKKCNRALRNPLRTACLVPYIAVFACMACNSAGRYGMNAQPGAKFPVGRAKVVEKNIDALHEAAKKGDFKAVSKLLKVDQGSQRPTPLSIGAWATRRRMEEQWFAAITERRLSHN